MIPAVLEDRVLFTLSHKPKVLAVWPELGALTPYRVESACCGGNKQRKILSVLELLKKQVATLRPDQLGAIKEALGVTSIKVITSDPTGRVIETIL